MIEELDMEERVKQQNEKACVSVGRIESTLLSSFVKKGKETSNKRNYKRNKRKAEEEICSKPTKKRQARGFVHCKEEEKVKKTRKRKSKRQQKDNKNEVDEALRLQRRTRYLLIKMKMQQNLIDAYATEGWKGQRYNILNLLSSDPMFLMWKSFRVFMISLDRLPYEYLILRYERVL